jgi:hypothetical protein
MTPARHQPRSGTIWRSRSVRVWVPREMWSFFCPTWLIPAVLAPAEAHAAAAGQKELSA